MLKYEKTHPPSYEGKYWKSFTYACLRRQT